MKNALHPILNIFILFISLAILTYSIWHLYQLINLKYNSKTAQGIITGYYAREDNARFSKDRKNEYAPVFSFKNEKNEELTVITKTYKENMKFKKGDVVKVYYTEQNPDKAQIDDSFPWTRHIMMSLAAMVGMFYTLSKYFNYKI